MAKKSNEVGVVPACFGQLEEIKAGEKEETVVRNINEGKQKDFRTDAYWAKVDDTKENIERMKEQPAVEVSTDNKASIVINMPLQGDKVNPKSKLALWKKTYGDWPGIGQRVTTKVDENGFNRIVLEV